MEETSFINQYMNLKNLMEDKQLDFNQPLLSVRRASSTAVSSRADHKRKTDNSLPKIPPLPVYKSELKSGPVRNPGTVPFVWEQTPGKPKAERKEHAFALEQPHIAPKFPPGRVPNLKQQDLDEASKASTITLSKTDNVLPRSQNVLSLDKIVTTYESSKEKVEVEVKESVGSEDGDEAYLDALDTISRTDSFFMNCSISGVSNLDSPDVKPSGTFSMDTKTRDLMMGRFLPAAKAMASETPPHATWKQPVLREQLRQVEKAVTREKRVPLNLCRENVVLHQFHNLGAEESEDEADDHYGSEISSSRVCGLFPRFCLKGSLCLLNPLPGMSMQSGVPISPVHRVKANCLHSVSCSQPGKELAGNAAREQKRSLERHQPAKQDKNKIEVKSESDQTAYKSNCGKPDKSHLNRHLQGNGISGCRDESSGKAKSSKVNESDSHGKGHNNFRELLGSKSAIWDLGCTSPVVEKTLYIDSVHTVQSRNSSLSSSDMRGLTDFREDDFGIPVKQSEMEQKRSVDSSLQDFKHLSVIDEKAKRRPGSSESVDSGFRSCSDRSNHDIDMEMGNDSKECQDLILDSIALASLKAGDNKTIDSESRQPVKSGDPKGSYGLDQGFVALRSSMTDNRKIDLENRQPKKDCTIEKGSAGLIKDSVTFASSKPAEKINLESRRTKFGDRERSQGSHPHNPLGPPLPKSPSESWLQRTLPTISSRNLPSKSSLAMGISTRNQASKTTSHDSNWETIVKTSNIHHGHFRFSEELLTPIPEA